MLKAVFYILAGIPSNITLAMTKKDSVFILKINEHHYDDLLSFYRKAEQCSPFCFCIDISYTYTSQFLNLIESFFYLPSYYRKNELPFVFSDTTIFGKLSPEAIELLLGEKGVPLKNCILEKKKYAHHAHLLELAYQDMAFSDRDEESEFFIEIEDIRIAEEIHCIIKETDAAIQNKESRNYDLKVKIKKLYSENEAKEALLSAAVKEIENLNNYLDIIRSNSQAKELQEYYNKEYEILPKWYKQLGHIVKVIMGKRTFRSLFDKKVKKYKE